MKQLDITDVPEDETYLSWLIRIAEQFQQILMTEKQLMRISNGTGWGTLRGVPIKIAKVKTIQCYCPCHKKSGITMVDHVIVCKDEVLADIV